MDNEKKQTIIIELLRRLNGECSDSGYTCPKNIEIDLYYSSWFHNYQDWHCFDCEALFPIAYKNTIWLDRRLCPCELVEKAFLTKKHLFRVLRKKAKGE